MNVSTPRDIGPARPGLDPNDTSWVVVRYARDWSPPREDPPGAEALEPAVLGSRFARGLHYQASRQVVELRPLVATDAGEWLPLDAVTDSVGNRYRSHPGTHQVLMASACDVSFTPLQALGHGWQTGRLRRPLGLSVTHRDHLLIADSGNHRIQVFDLKLGQVIAVIGALDDWGQPCAGDDHGALRHPSHAILDPRTCLVHVADPGNGRVHVFDAAFRHRRSFVPTPLTSSLRVGPARPAAVAAAGDGTTYVVDTSFPQLLRVDASGTTIEEVPFQEAPEWLWPSLRDFQRYADEGEVVIGPIDGVAYDAAWHRILVDAKLPEGTALTVQTFASNDKADGPANAQEPFRMPWAPADPVRIPSVGADSQNGESSRLVLSDWDRWVRNKQEEYARDFPVVQRFSSDPTRDESARPGPRQGDTRLRLAAGNSRHVRAGDRVRLVDTGQHKHEESALVLHVPDTEVEFEAEGTPQLFPVGTTIRLHEREGNPLPGDARGLGTLRDTWDLGRVRTGGWINVMPVPHDVAMLLLPRDLVEVQAPNTAERLWLRVSSLNHADTEILLEQAVTQDYLEGAARSDVTPGRLVIEDLTGFEKLPPLGESIRVVRRHANGDLHQATATVNLVDRATRAVWFQPGDLELEFEEGWLHFEPTAEVRPTDRGRYLWVRLRAWGPPNRDAANGTSVTPMIRAVRALLPRHSYLRYLPPVFGLRDPSEDPTGALFLERFLAMFEGELTRQESSYEDVSRKLNPEVGDPEWQQFVAGWMGLPFFETTPPERKRQLLLEASRLFELRGTPAGIVRYIELLIGTTPSLVERFRTRPAFAVVGSEGVLGCCLLGGSECESIGRSGVAAKHAHQFNLYLPVSSSCDPGEFESVVRAIVDLVKPAHTEYRLHLIDSTARAGVQSIVGVNLVLAKRTGPPTVLGGLEPPYPDVSSPDQPRPGHMRVARLPGDALKRTPYQASPRGPTSDPGVSYATD